MRARDSFDAPPPRQPGRVERVDIFLSIRAPLVPEVPAVMDGDVEVAPAVPAHIETTYIDTFDFHRPDEAGGSDERCHGALRKELTATRKGHVKGLLDHVLAKANGE